MNPVISREYVEKNFIHKDKIKEAIKELEELMEEDEVDEFGNHSIGWAALDYMIDYMNNKFLEETKDENSNTAVMQEQKEQSTNFNK